MMITKKNWLQFFPFEKVRSQQEEAINFILNIFINKNKRFALLEGSPGSGKSAIAITVARYLNEAWVITPQRILQKQYQNDFSFISSIWSKEHYECPGKYVSCQLGSLINKVFKNKYCQCIYQQDKRNFLSNKISLTNVAFFLNHIEYSDEIKQRKLLVVDEAHTIDAAISDFISININKYNIENYNLEWPKNKIHSIDEIFSWIKEYLIINLVKIKDYLDQKIKNLSQDQLIKNKNLLKQLNNIERYIKQLDRCVSRFNKDEWILSVNKEEDELSLKPLFSSKYSHKQLFCVGEKILLMSGTILDKEIYCRNIGISVEETEFLSLDSPFKKENRTVFSVNVGSLNYRDIDNNLPKIANAITKLIAEHRLDKGLIHCTSYKIADYIVKNVKTNRFISHDSSNRMEMYELHLKSDKPTILISPSMTEGIDLYDDLSRFQIIVKTPFPNLGDNFIVEKKKRVKDWYLLETAKTIIQSSGRSIRNENDWCKTYILDSSFIFFYKNNRKLFPLWYQQALIFV